MSNQPNDPPATGTADQTITLAHPGGSEDAQPGSSVAGFGSEPPLDEIRGSGQKV